MEKERFEQLAMDYLRGEMNEEQKLAFESFLEQNPKNNNDLTEIKRIWIQMDAVKIPEPSEEMDERFFNRLYGEIEKIDTSSKQKTGLFRGGSSWLTPQLAYGILILLIGLTLGYFLKPNGNGTLPSPEVVSNQEATEIREKLVLTLLEQPSANKRLQGVSEANKIEKVDEKVINALLKTLNHDSNVNVRLAAIESLTNYVDNPSVRQGLVQAIPNQESPMVQVTLANLMTALQEKESIEPFRRLLREKELDTTVKKKIESTIESII